MVYLKICSYIFPSVYDDVPKAFEEWTSSGKKLYIYSSGSVDAQKLLFGDSVHGDLLKVLIIHQNLSKQIHTMYKNFIKILFTVPQRTF